ncbi:serine hydrolase [Phenylobacterium sp. 20VBR1]|uniref:beta-lactamase n=1 Tax=Phenylobacterium glaciei TaxID=2803784 RepID=A0A941D3V3_9CAUL|nr:serine hydrolase [Phenylobacterium glaciei]MBR7621820.1 serine hydrolase [Phenylobacterium glaciei]
MNQGLGQLRAWGRSGVDGVSDLGVSLLVASLRVLTWIENLTASWPQARRDLAFDTRMFWRARWRPASALAVLAGLTILGGVYVATGTPAKAPPPTILAAGVGAPRPHVAPRPKPGPPPEALQKRLDELAENYRETVGIAVADCSEGWMAQVAGDDAFPQQSVSKLWVAMTTMDALDQGKLSLDQGVFLGPQDRSVFFQPISHKIGATGYATTLRDLVRRALIESDNAANDKLLEQVGGVDAVADMLARKNLTGIRMGADEKNLQAKIAGLTWSPEMGVGGNFKDARARLPDSVRDAAMKEYLENPLDGATPAGLATALMALKRGELLSAQSTDTFLATMSEARTGPRRLKGGLPSGWSIAHKTGTGQDWRGGSIGINDVAVLTAPDGRSYAVVVLMKRTTKPVPARLAFMQQVSKAVVTSWESERDGARKTLASLRPGESSGGH